MNRILKLSGQNIQGSSFLDELHPVTLYVGDNARGKTTRINALHLALCGFAPGMSKKGSDIFKEFASGNPLTVEAWFDSTNHCGNSWTERNGSVKSIQLGNGAYTIPPVAIDADVYFGLSGPAQTRFLFSCAKLPDELTIPKLCNSITANIKNIKVEENTESTEQVVEETTKFLYDIYFQAGPDVSPQDWIANLSQSLKEKLNLANQNAQRMEKTVQGLTQIKEQSEPVPQDAEALLATAQAELKTANDDVARLKEVGENLGREIKSAKEIAAKNVDESVILNQISELENKRPVSVQPPGDKPGLMVMTNDRPTDSKERESLNVLVENANSSSRAKADAEALVKQLETNIEKAKEQTTCPTCGHDITGKQKSIVSGLKSQLKAAKEKIKPLVKAHESNVSIEAEAVRKLNAVTEAITDWDRQKKFADDQNKTASEAWEKRNTAYNNFQSALNTFNSDLNALKAKLTDKSGSEAASKLPKLEEQINGARTEYKTAAELAIKRKTTVDQADRDYRRLVAQRADAVSRSKAITDAQKARAEAGVLKQAVDLVLSLQSELVEKTIGPILERCNRLCKGVLQYPLDCREGEIGMAKPDGFVTKLLSGTERALTRCAVSLALASESPLKLAVLDEMGRLSARNKRILVANIIKLVDEGEIDQAILVDTEADDYQSFVTGFKNVFGVITV